MHAAPRIRARLNSNIMGVPGVGHGDDIINATRFSFRDVVNDDSDDELAKLEHRGEKEEDNTADGILLVWYQ